MKKHWLLLLLGAFLLGSSIVLAQSKNDVWDAGKFSGLKFRSLGPAFMSGRIADIAIHPEDENVWYVAVGSGGVWKTTNAGVTWTSIFDDQKSFSIGCVTIDPSNSDVVWVGTGENVGGRHVGFGDGIYKSEDGGKTWKNMGLKNSEHLSKIVIHPTNSEVIWVASQGPLWSSGGERGVYKSEDGGGTWSRVLGDDKWVGATEIVLDPRDPDVLYAATWQRHRTIAAYMGGGPGSGLRKSTDGGSTWTKLSQGLPTSHMGKIGLAISPQKPDVLYAAIELDHRTGAVYKSVNQGVSWTKQSDAVSGATGPHYYQELYACPHNFDRLYLVDVRMQISDDGGKTFRRMKEKDKHSDNHAIAFRQDDPDYLLVGTDGGLYESFDLAEHWRFFGNLPVTQFYDLAMDDSEPFYHIFGGTQDNNTQGGPTRTDNYQGIQNGDWKVVLNWDGHQPATEPGNPHIMYGQRQQGTLSRIDMSTGEIVDVQPRSGEGEPHERFNWDAPILVSAHDPQRVYFASQRLWRSDNRGDAWKAISPDLTKNQNRLELPIMGRKQSYDNAWDLFAMSNYNTITMIAESPINENLLFIGTDDGRIQRTEDGGAHWTKMDVGSMPGVPATAYVNDIKADLFDENTVYVALDNHKYGDFKPYLLKSTDKGKSWKNIATTELTDRNLVWRIVQDHVNKDLLFLGTEFGVYFTINGGQNWVKMTGGFPCISARDIQIHRRENDLAVATFGRGFYILDDMTPLRHLKEEALSSGTTLFPVRDAWWYFPRPDLSFGAGAGSQGSAHFIAPNPEFGATFTYFMADTIAYSGSKARSAQEKVLAKENKDIPFPGWDALAEEKLETKPQLWFVIKDKAGNVVNKVKSDPKKGMNRVTWDLKYSTPYLLNIYDKNKAGMQDGFMVPPGEYTVSMHMVDGGMVNALGEEQTFVVKPLHKVGGSLEGSTAEATTAFWREYEKVTLEADQVRADLGKGSKMLDKVQYAITNSSLTDQALLSQAKDLSRKWALLNQEMNGNPAKNKIGEKNDPLISERLFDVYRAVYHSTYGPTQTAKDGMEIVKKKLAYFQKEILENKTKIESLKEAVGKNAGVIITD